jgi:hypothetical protein
VNKLEQPPTPNPAQTPQLPGDRPPGQAASEAKPRTGRLIFLMTVLVLLLGALGIGSWKHYWLAAEAPARSCQRSSLAFGRMLLGCANAYPHGAGRTHPARA